MEKSRKPISVIELLSRTRNTLNRKGPNVLRGLAANFPYTTSGGIRKISKDELQSGLSNFGIRLAKPELYALTNAFYTDEEGFLDFDAFLIGLRGKPNQRRQAMIDKAFLKFDKDCSGYLDAVELKQAFNAKLHPKVQSGEKTVNQVFLEFLQNFPDRNLDGKIQRVEWNDYYAAVSSSIDDDDDFIRLMRAAWKID